MNDWWVAGASAVSAFGFFAVTGVAAVRARRRRALNDAVALAAIHVLENHIEDTFRKIAQEQTRTARLLARLQEPQDLGAQYEVLAAATRAVKAEEARLHGVGEPPTVPYE